MKEGERRQQSMWHHTARSTRTILNVFSEDLSKPNQSIDNSHSGRLCQSFCTSFVNDQIATWAQWQQAMVNKRRASYYLVPYVPRLLLTTTPGYGVLSTLYYYLLLRLQRMKDRTSTTVARFAFARVYLKVSASWWCDCPLYCQFTLPSLGLRILDLALPAIYLSKY